VNNNASSGQVRSGQVRLKCNIIYVRHELRKFFNIFATRFVFRLAVFSVLHIKALRQILLKLSY
jgi:hypothetical protein